MESLTKEIFNNEMGKLITLYNYSATKEQMGLYFEYLSDLFGPDEFIGVCKEIPTKERFFPSISVFCGAKKKTLADKAF